MQVFFNEHFKKRFQKLPAKIQKQFHERLKLFLRNPMHPQLRSHPLHGNLLGCRAFSVSGDYRAIYRMEGVDVVCFIDIGRHGQVY